MVGTYVSPALPERAPRWDDEGNGSVHAQRGWNPPTFIGLRKSIQTDRS